MTIGERIKKMRRELNLTQQKFAEQIGTTQNGIASYEIGRREPSAAVLNNICKTFNVNEHWLRTGEGEMFIQRTSADELTAAVERLLAGESTEFKRRLVIALSALNDEHWLLLEQKLKEIVGMQDPPARTDADIEREVEDFRRRLIMEKKQGGTSSPSSGAGSLGDKMA